MNGLGAKPSRYCGESLVLGSLAALSAMFYLGIVESAFELGRRTWRYRIEKKKGGCIGLCIEILSGRELKKER